jgi:hypothetical protein
MTDLSSRHPDLVAAVDRFGSDLGLWPDASLARRARAAALADREFRAYLDGAAALGRALAGARAALEEEIDRSGAATRIAASVLSRRPAQPLRPRWFAIAAAMVLAAGLGGLIDADIAGTRTAGGAQTVVALDPLIFGTVDTGVQ